MEKKHYFPAESKCSSAKAVSFRYHCGFTMRRVVKQKTKRVYQNKMWDAARFYCKEAEKCYKARAYFSALVARGCELEALLRLFDFVENRRPKDRCKQLYWLINRVFARHWIPHDALRYWKKAERIPLKTCLHEIREARNGVHAHLFERDILSVTTPPYPSADYVVQIRNRNYS
jgi:hypothetical protein